ncbi:hypothetical protein SARC_07620 [Sphaeroforma arctica JP610]|uniref:Protein kinase domain-containing protein n=1 Tax=Sphaeroforma arctica JP610 TaxID=667725 RepID=A0A0L0FT74_9EUKA|nr:hypothetical protein SARC_07620 [Sphaeroforma arctica JP610]KNC80005.1 hypothetical protein SARC_07620 [Sphaeroforma arctica JP610]|eukprot:XP_014153907.1 hypothetical protein SARC_07620 [Sphaeroforma arctica JP610]
MLLDVEESFHTDIIDTTFSGISKSLVRPPTSFNTIKDRLPNLSGTAVKLLKGLMTYDPHGRLSARDALSHPYFREAPTPTSSEMLPTFPEHRNATKSTPSTRRAKSNLSSWDLKPKARHAYQGHT